MSVSDARKPGVHADAKRMSERQLSKAIVELAEHLGWKVFTIAQTKAAGLRSHTGTGFPDLILVRNRTMIAAELKVGRRKLTQAQEDWLEALYEVPGVYTFVWREEHWLSGRIEEELRHRGCA